MDSRLVLIEGLPGSGKSTLAEEVGRRLSSARVCLENRGANPLNAFEAESDVAEFREIYALTADEVAERMLGAWHRLAKSDPGLIVIESQPYQSGARLLLQMDAPQELITEYLMQVQTAASPLAPQMIFLRTSADNVGSVAALRGSEWFSSVCAFIERTPWAQHRSLSGEAAAFAFVEEYAARVDQWLASSAFTLRILLGGKDLGEETFAEAAAWLIQAVPDPESTSSPNRVV